MNPDYSAAGATGNATHAQAGVITQGGTVTAHGSTGITGAMPGFTCSGSTGSTSFHYWVVANQSGAGQGNGASAPLYVGNTANTCSGTVTGYFPAILPAAEGTVTYDILRTTASGTTFVAPYSGGCGGGSASACGSVIVGKAQGGGSIESFTDNAGSNTTSYSPGALAFVPYLGFWPGNLVLSASVPNNRTAVPVSSFVGEQNLVGGNGVGVVSVNGGYSPSTFSLGGTGGQSGLMGGNAAGLGSIDVHLGGYNTATFLMRGQQANVEGANLKGRLNFIGNNLGGFNNGSIITLVDSTPDKTAATANYRPAMDATDVWIGTDNSSYQARTSIPLALGSPVSISHYINALPDGSSWKERLTSSLKTFTVPVQAPTLNATTGIQVGGAYGSNGQCLLSTGTGSAWGACSGGASSPLSAKGDLFTFGTIAARLAVGTDGQCLTADSTSVLGLKWGTCGSGGGVQDSAVVHNTGVESIAGVKTFTNDANFQGSVTVAGSLSVGGPYQVVSDIPTQVISSTANKTTLAVDTDGKLKVSENGGAVMEVAKVNSAISAAQMPALTGDVTSAVGGVATTIATGAVTPAKVNAVNKQGDGPKFAIAAGTFTTGHYRSTDGTGNAVDSGVVAGPYANTAWIPIPRSGTFWASSATNQATLWKVPLNFPITTSQVSFKVYAADTASCTYEIGILNSAGTVVAHTGSMPASTTFTSAVNRTRAWVGGAVTLQPGLYYIAVTASGSTGCATLASGSGDAVVLFAGNVAVTSGGTLNDIASPPADSPIMQASALNVVVW